MLFWVAFTFRNRMRTAFRQVRARQANLNTFLAENIGGMAIVQLFNRQRAEQEEFRRLNASYRDANLPVIMWDASLFAFVEALSSVAIGLIIWYGGGEIVQGTLTFGALVAFIQYIEKFFSPIRDLSAKYSVMQGAMAALERIFHLLDTEKAEEIPLGPPLSKGETPSCPLSSPINYPREGKSHLSLNSRTSGLPIRMRISYSKASIYKLNGAKNWPWSGRPVAGKPRLRVCCQDFTI